VLCICICLLFSISFFLLFVSVVLLDLFVVFCGSVYVLSICVCLLSLFVLEYVVKGVFFVVFCVFVNCISCCEYSYNCGSFSSWRHFKSKVCYCLIVSLYNFFYRFPYYDFRQKTCCCGSYVGTISIKAIFFYFLVFYT